MTPATRLTDADMSAEESVERTDDGRHIIVNGRRWRATDPSIPESFRQELVDELMSARRGVKSGAADARSRVHDAKHALGERGHPWWEEPTPEQFDDRAAATIRALLRKRDGSSICPSDVARAIGGEGEAWRTRMPDVRRVAASMADREEVVVTQKGVAVRLDEVRGPVRINRGPEFGHTSD